MNNRPMMRTRAKRALKCACCLFTGLILGYLLAGCSALQPSTKSQSMTVTALGFPAITVVTTSTQSATNDGDDDAQNTQSVTNDVKPDTDTSIVPAL